MLRGTKRALVSRSDTGTPNKNKVDLALMARLHNRWDVEVVDAATGEVKQRAQGFNVILDRWWTEIASGNQTPSWIQYGRGTGTPAASDTGLFSRISYVNASGSRDDSTLSQGFISWKYSAQLAPNVAVGETITEVGLSYSTGGSTTVTHAILTDMNGNPISITKTATDIVNIYATVFLHLTTDRYANGKLRLTTQVSWMSGNNTTSASVGIRVYQSRYGSDSGTSNKTTSYDAATRTRTYAFSQIPAADANYAGGALFINFGYSANSSWTDERNAWLIMYPAGMSQILGEAVGTGNGTKTDFKTKFAFPSDATVYVDGVAQTSGVTVYPDHPALASSSSRRLDYFLAPVAMVTTPDKLVLFDSFTDSDSYGTSIAAGEEKIYERMVDGLSFTALKLTTTTAGNVTIFASDDLETWTNVGATFTSDSWWSIPAQYGGAKYFKIRNNKASLIQLAGGESADLNSYAIRFDSPPAAGAVITADYKTPMIPKDENHVMDVTLSITFGEYTGGDA